MQDEFGSLWLRSPRLVAGLFVGAPHAAAQDGEFDLVIGDNCFVLEQEPTTITQVDEYNQRIDVGEALFVQVPCGDEDEVLGITQTPDEVLALTGSSVSTPVTVGLGLVGTGGLLLYAAKRRERAEDEANEIVGAGEFVVID